MAPVLGSWHAGGAIGSWSGRPEGARPLDAVGCGARLAHIDVGTRVIVASIRVSDSVMITLCISALYGPKAW